VRREAGHERKDGAHILRHSCATMLMQAGIDPFEAAGYLGMSEQTLREVYGHHHPDYLRSAAAAIAQKGRFVSVVESVVDSGETSDQNKKPND